MNRGFLIFILAICMGFTGCQKISHSRTRITVTVESDGKTYTGSSVQEFKCRDRLWIMTPGCDTKGEALLVDIQGRGYLFVTMNLSDGRFHNTYGEAILGTASPDRWGATNKTLPPKWTLTSEQMPLMVKFTDLNDAQSVKIVDPNDLTKSYGDGVRLSSLIVETTSDKITWGTIKTVLPWINDEKNHFYSLHSENELAQNLSQYDFVSGKK